MRPRATSCLLLAALGGHSAIATATPAGGRVLMQVENQPGSEACVARSELERAVEARLDRAVFTHSSDAPLLIRLRLGRPTRREWTAELELFDARGHSLGRRELATRAAQCSVLDDSLALVVALLVDAPLEEQLRKEASAATSAAPETPLPEPETTPLLIPKDTHAPRAPWRASARASITLSLGALPAAAAGFELGAGLLSPAGFAFQAFGGGAPARSTTGAAGARVSLWYGGLELCALQRTLGSARWSIWLGETVGAVRAQAFGFDSSSAATRVYVAPFARMRWVFPVSSQLGVLLDGRAELPLLRSSFVAETSDGDERDIFRVSSVVGVLGVGLVVEPE